jgi:hypothetical protein
MTAFQTDMNTLVEVDESWVRSIVFATKQYAREIEIQNITEQSRYTECAGVDLMLEGVALWMLLRRPMRWKLRMNIICICIA